MEDYNTSALDWFCGEEFKILQNGNLGLCFFQTFVIGIWESIIFLYCLFYYFLYLKSHRNFNGNALPRQKSSAQFIFNLKLLCLFGIMSQWLWMRLNSNSLHNPYAMQKIVFDILHFTVWYTVLSVVFMEWNRSLSHSIVMRLIWLVSMLLQCNFFYSLLLRSNVQKVDKLEIVGHAVMLTCHGFLAIFGFFGYFSRMRIYFEADQTYKERQKELEYAPPMGVALVLLWRHIISIETTPWLTMAWIISVGRGYIFQLQTIYYGMVFNSAISEPCTAPDVFQDETKTSACLNTVLDNIHFLLYVYIGSSFAAGLAQTFWSIGAEKLVNGQQGIRRRLFHHMVHLEVAYHNMLGPDLLTHRFSHDAEAIKIAFESSIPRFWEALSAIVVGLYWLFSIDWSITLYMLTLVPLIYGMTHYVSQLSHYFDNVGRANFANVEGKIYDVFSKFPVVLVYGKRNTEQYQFRKILTDVHRVLSFKTIIQGIFLVVIEWFDWMTYLIAVFLAIHILLQEDPNWFGIYVSYCLYAINIISGIVVLLTQMPKMTQTVSSFSNLLSMIDRTPQLPEDEYVGLIEFNDLVVKDGSIKFDGVWFAYPTASSEEKHKGTNENDHEPGEEELVKKIKNKKKEVLKDISFVVRPNTKVAIVGPSGGGKRTIFQLIARFYDPTDGKISIDGTDISRCNTRSIRASMAIVNPNNDLFAGTLFENIVYGHDNERFGTDLSNKKINEILQALEDDTFSSLPQDLREIIDRVMQSVTEANARDFITNEKDLTLLIGEGGKELSGAEKQCVSLARAMYKNPKIVLLDEVTVPPDKISEKLLRGTLEKWSKNKTLIVISQRLHLIQNFHEIIILDKGKIVDQGSHSYLVNNCVQYRDMMQAGRKAGKEREDLELITETDKLCPEITHMLTRLYQSVMRDRRLAEKYRHRIEELLPGVSGVPSTSEEILRAGKKEKTVHGTSLFSEDMTDLDDVGSIHMGEEAMVSLDAARKQNLQFESDEEVHEEDSGSM